MRILLIGNEPFRSHHTQIIRRFLEKENEVDYINERSYDLQPDPHEIRLEKDYDYVIVFQNNNTFKIVKNGYDTRVIQYCEEQYWKVSCVNPDYLILGLPELKRKYQFVYPNYFSQLKGVLETTPHVNIDEYDPNCPKKPGVFYQGFRFTKELLDTNYHLFRRAYDNRSNFLKEVDDIVEILPIDYENDYAKSISTLEANLVIQSNESYMSKRPVENMAAGSINLLHIKDSYQIHYYEKMGFVNMVNCYFIINRNDILDFIRLDSEKKAEIRKNAYELFIERFTTQVMWDEWVKWINDLEFDKYVKEHEVK